MPQGRFPPPEMVRFPTGDGLSPETPAYYWGEQTKDTRWQIVAEEDDEKRVDPDELPPAAQGRGWRFARTTEGKIYWIEDDAARIAEDERRKAEEAQHWADRRKAIAESVARDRVTEPPLRGAPPGVGGAGSQSGLAAMRQRIEANARQLGQIVGGSVRVTETGTGFDVELFSASGGVSTSAGGSRKIGNVTLDRNGRPVAVDIPGAQITEDGRVIIGKKVALPGVSIHAKGALSLEDGLRALTSSIAEAVTDFGEGLGLGGTSADRVPDL